MSPYGLVLAAHGSREPGVNEAVESLADQCRAAGRFAEVATCFHQGEPAFHNVLDHIKADRVVVVPVMSSDGYYASKQLPEQLALNRRYHEVSLLRTAPVGTHPKLAGIVAARLRRLIASHDLDVDQLSVGVAAHGTRRHVQSRRAAQSLARQLSALGSWGEVSTGFIDDDPPISTLRSGLRGDTLIVVPFMMNIGPHLAEDIPRCLGMDAQAGPFPWDMRDADIRIIMDEPLGSYRELPELVLDLARDRVMHAGRVLRVGTRASEMAVVQARRVADLLFAAGWSVELETCSTLGDRRQDRPIHELGVEAPFAEDLEAAMLGGRFSLAVHSLKDLPLTLPDGVAVSAILPRDDAREALVSQGGRGLSDLPKGATVGTSSPRRRAQLLRLRPDLTAVPLRGPVEARVSRVLAGEIDAAVLALAGLQRLGLEEHVAEVFAPTVMVPAPGQGALAVEVAVHDREAVEAVSALDDALTRECVSAELAFLRLAGSLHEFAVAAYAKPEGASGMVLTACLLSLDGSQAHTVSVPGKDAAPVAERAWSDLRERVSAPGDVPS